MSVKIQLCDHWPSFVFLLVPWYIGCYNNSEVPENASFIPFSEEDEMTPVYCVSLCTFNERYVVQSRV